MAALLFPRLVYLLLFLTSITANTASRVLYTEYGLDNEKICHPSSRKSQSIEMKGSAIIVKPNHVFDYRNVRKDCRFTIKTKKGEHLSAVINTISLHFNGTDCVDYVQFERSDGQLGQKFCKPFNETKETDVENGVQIPDDQLSYAEHDVKGEIRTHIFISSIPTDIKRDLLIVYTPYKDCSKNILPEDQLASENKSFSICLRKEYFCDTYQNCASYLCKDERNCPEQKNVISNETGNKVTAGAVTTIFLCFIIFILFLWICRKHKKMCWSPDCAGPIVDSNLPMDRNVASRPTARLNPPYISTAPMLEVAVPASLHDKDLPPSYDSLFPSQADTTSST